MKVSASIQLVWEMAGRETVAGGFEEISPEHFCLALLKFAELPVDEIGASELGAGAAQELAADVERLRRELQKRSIDSTKKRRELRRRLGTGGREYQGGEIHRSQASRKLFDDAARRVDDAGGDTLEPIHLFNQLMESPSDALARIFGTAAGSTGTDVRTTPILDAFAEDVSEKAREGELRPAEDRTAECKAVLEALGQSGPGLVFLVTDSESAARAVLRGLAHAVLTPDAPRGTRRARILDATRHTPYGPNGASFIGQLKKGLDEAHGLPGLIVVLPDVQEFDKRTPDPWASFLAANSALETPRCITRFSRNSYESWIRQDPAWKQHGRVVWVLEHGADSVPWEL